MAFGHQQSGPRKLAVSIALARCSKLVHLLSSRRSNSPRQHRLTPSLSLLRRVGLRDDH